MCVFNWLIEHARLIEYQGFKVKCVATLTDLKFCMYMSITAKNRDRRSVEERRYANLATVLIIVAVFFVVVLGIMIRTEMKSTARRDINAFGAPPKRPRTRALDGTYIVK